MRATERAEAPATVTIHFRDVERDDVTLEALERRCQDLSSTFPETTHYELSLSSETAAVSAHGHVRGKGIDFAASASASDPRVSAERVLDKLERGLRRGHDKRIFGRRRVARRSSHHHHEA